MVECLLKSLEFKEKVLWLDLEQVIANFRILADFKMSMFSLENSLLRISATGVLQMFLHLLVLSRIEILFSLCLETLFPLVTLDYLKQK